MPSKLPSTVSHKTPVSTADTAPAAGKAKSPPVNAVAPLADEFIEARLVGLLSELEDPREPSKVVFPLPHLLMLAVAATLCLHDNFPLMADWAEENGAWLFQELAMPPLPRMPSHDCFRTTFGLLASKELNRLLSEVAGARRAGTLERLVLVDGKALRYTYTTDADEGGRLLVLNAYDANTGAVVGCTLVPGTTCESAQLPDFIKTLQGEGAIFSIDAAGSYRPVTEAILAQKADFVCVVRDNQPTLHRAIEAFFTGWGVSVKDPMNEETIRKLALAQDMDYATFNTKSKGREVTYALCMSRWTDLIAEELGEKHPWPGIKSIGVMERLRRNEKGKLTRTLTYIISSLDNAETILAAAKDRWKIENNLHWVLDVTYREDACRTLEMNAAANLSILRRVSLNALKRCPTKGSIKAARLKCCSSRSWLLKVMRQFIVDSEA